MLIVGIVMPEPQTDVEYAMRPITRLLYLTITHVSTRRVMSIDCHFRHEDLSCFGIGRAVYPIGDGRASDTPPPGSVRAGSGLL